MMNLENKVVTITGGYGYLGKAITEGLASQGATILVLGRSEDKFQNAFLGSDSSENIYFVEGDVADPNSLSTAFNNIGARWGSLDGLINNAFYLRGQDPLAMSETDFTFGLEGCLTSIYSTIKCANTILNEGSSLVNLSSMYGMVSPEFEVYNDYPEFLNPPHYGAAKAGVLQLTRYYSALLAKRGIRVNAVSPGPFPSSQVQKNKSFIEELSKRTLLGRVGKPEELSGIFAYLISDASSYVTGQNFVIDGGWTVR